MTINVLERELYVESEAAHLLRVPQSTLHYWLEGGSSRGVTYPPVLRPERTGSRNLTWAEFVEATLLRAYRRDLNVAMRELRLFITKLRDELGVPHPLATAKPWTDGQQLIIDAQEAASLPSDFWLFTPTRNQDLLPLEPASWFLDRVDFGTSGSAERIRPNPASPVVIDPLRRFGAPSIKGTSTSVLWEHVEAGYTVDEVAELFDLSISEVRWAVSYESTPEAA